MIKRFFACAASAALLTGCAAYGSQEVASSPATQAEITRSGAVSSADPRATAAGEAILAKGGSATDAAIAVMVALTVVEPQSSGIGGGGFLVRADGNGRELLTYDGRETAPRAATGTRFLDDDGERLPRETRVLSGLSVGVPGNIALAAKAHAAHGKLDWAELFQPAIVLADKGFRMNVRLNESLSSRKERAGLTREARAVFFGADGEPLPVGSLVRNGDLAEALTDIAATGPEALYDRNAEDLAEYIAEKTPADGKMVTADITSYVAKLRDPVCARYRAYKVCG
ncbi:MAG: gamma-glutamyltransferase, partial [Pseudomonadota bacterium]